MKLRNVFKERGSLMPLILGYLSLLTAALVVATSIGQVATANALLNNIAEEIALACASSVDQNTYYANGGLVINQESAKVRAQSLIASAHSLILAQLDVKNVEVRGSQVAITVSGKTRILTGQWRTVSAKARAEVRVNPVG
jgi:hypothetical protein